METKSDHQKETRGGVSLADEDDEDHPHLPSPMYESEMGPQGSKFKSMKHPAQVPVTPSTKIDNIKDVQASPFSKPDNIKSVHVIVSPTPSPKPNPNINAQPNQFSSGPSPSQASTSHETPKPEAQTTKSGPAEVSLSPVMKSSHPSMPSATEGKVTAPTQPSIATKHNSTEAVKTSPGLDPPAFETRANLPSASNQLQDKGVSVKEYITQKFEPGEDEEVLSQVISDAINHEKDDNVVEKVREAVTSLLGNEHSSPQPNRSAYHSAQCSLAQIPQAVEAAEARTS